MEILKLIPSCKAYLWGGDKLRTTYHKQSDGDNIAESWELSCHPEGHSMIANGDCAGKTLAEYLALRGKHALGENCAGMADFPLLIKFIDAKQDLSVQVHPDDAYARKYEQSAGKTEMWTILSAEPDAQIVFGFNQEMTKEQFAKKLAAGTLPEVLRYVKVKPGDSFFIQAGTLHAIGKGIVIAEVQQSSALTYRVYDYDRMDKDGNRRELHVQKALDVMDFSASVGSALTPEVLAEDALHTVKQLCLCQYFAVKLVEVKRKAVFMADDTSFHSLSVLEGDAQIDTLHCQTGDTCFVPAGAGMYTISGCCTVLHVSMPPQPTE